MPSTSFHHVPETCAVLQYTKLLLCLTWLFWPTPAVLCGPPPEVENARMYGAKKQHYQVNSIIRYQCNEGFTQRRPPVVRCLHDGQWEKPQVECRMCKYMAVIH